MNTVTSLEYAPVTRRKSRWKWIRRIFLLIVVLSLSSLIYYNRIDLSLRVRRVYWCYRCMHHVTPPGTVLVESDPVRMTALLASNSDYVMDGPPWNFANTVPFPKRAVYWPLEYRNFRATFRQRYIYDTPGATCFLGQRISGGGHRRLLVITSASLTPGNVIPLPWDVKMFVPPDMFGNLTPEKRLIYDTFGDWTRADLAPGVADSTDLSHLSISFVIHDPTHPRHGTIDIYLRDDDTLDIHVRERATTRGL